MRFRSTVGTISTILAFATIALGISRPVCAQSAPYVVQAIGANYTSQGILSFQSPVTKGNLLVAAVDANSSWGGTVSISDTLGSTWNLVFSNGWNGAYAFWYAIAPASGNDTITPTVNVPGAYLNTAIAELYGVTAEDQSAEAEGNYDNDVSSGFVTTSEANEILIGIIQSRGQYYDVPTAGSGWTWGFQAFPFAMEYQVVSSAGSYAATATYATYPWWSAHLVTFEPTVPSAPTISGLSPISGVTNTFVTISGTGFGATQGASTVTFNGVPVTPVSWRPNTIVVQVPGNISSGPVVVTVNGGASPGVNFTFSPGPGVTQATGTIYTISASFTNPVTKGDLLVAAVNANSAWGATLSITDSLGSTWNLAYSNGWAGAYAFWWAIAPASGYDTITPSSNVGVNFYTMAIAELYGVAAVDQVINAYASYSNNVSSGSVTTSAANEVLIGIIQSAGV
jgi:IPT/TIG domain